MKKTLTLVALLSLTTFTAIADELQTMTQEQAKLQTQNQMRIQTQEKQASWQSLTPDEQQSKMNVAKTAVKPYDSQAQNQMQNRMQFMQQNQMQNRTQSMQQNMGGRMNRGK